MYRKCLLVFLLCFGLATANAQTPKRTNSISQATTSGKSPWSRVVLIGASLSAGFTETEPLGGPNTPLYSLSRYVDAAIVPKHEPALNLSSAMFFLKPDILGRGQTAQAQKADPTLLLGVDFLFWFCYGDGRTEPERLKSLDRGMKMLESFTCPVVVGDLPDASGALNKMLSASQIPSPATLATANRHIKSWAAAHTNVAVLPLSAFMRAAVTNEAIILRKKIVPKGQTAALIQADQLHPTPPGVAVVAIATLDALLHKYRKISEKEVRSDPNEVFRLGTNQLTKPLKQ